MDHAEKTVEELATALPDIDWERPTRPQPQGLFVRRRRVVGL